MMRFYDIQRGSILVDGVDVRQQDMHALRRRFAVVLQDSFLFTGTIADNIRLGSKWITDERLERAADEVNVGDFIRSLPLQFAEPVQERGATLSTGQKQLISFARALAHDPGILILDEATSSVDTDTELRVRHALSHMVTGRTSILIAHRLSTIQRADTILVMHKGQLRERGTHQELLTHRGLYWKLYQLQYKDQETAADNVLPSATRRRSLTLIPHKRHQINVAENHPSPRIFLSAGEASGDHYGAQLIAELHSRHPDATFFGLGGKEMEASGLDRIVRAEDVAHMGITEVIRHMPRIYGEYRRLVASIKKRRPDAAILIDFPDVNLRLARELRKLNIPVVYFVSPQLWAWKRKRLRWVQQRVNRMMVIFPFEETFYRARGVDAAFVGHPLAQLPLPSSTRAEFAADAPTRSRKALDRPAPRQPPQRGTTQPARDAPRCRSFEPPRQSMNSCSPSPPRWTNPISAASSKISSHPKSPSFPMPAKPSTTPAPASSPAAPPPYRPPSSAIPSSSSTASLRSPSRSPNASSATPPRSPPKLDEHGNLPIAMVNLIAGRRIVPELLQDQFTAANIAAALTPLLADTPQRAQMIADLAETRHKLLSPSGSSPIAQVCDAVETLLGQNLSRKWPNLHRKRLTSRRLVTQAVPYF